MCEQEAKEGKEDTKGMSQSLHQHPLWRLRLALFTAPDGLGL